MILGVLSLFVIGYVVYGYNKKIDKTPIVEASFDPSKKDVIRLTNVKIPRKGLFVPVFHIYPKDNSRDVTEFSYHIRHNIFTVSYKIMRNGELFCSRSYRPYSFSYQRGYTDNGKYTSYAVDQLPCVSIQKRGPFFNKNDIVDIVIENQYPTDQFKDFEIIFKVHEQRPDL